MFVKDNTLHSARNYFTESLNEFSDSELKSMWTEIICKRFNWSRSDLLMNKDFRLSESDLLYIRSFVKRLQNNEPFQYLIGETEFYGLKIKCDKRALIPRPETEELVDWISEILAPMKIVDICSGSGCIALALKSTFKSASIIGIDISQDAVGLSNENAILNHLQVDFQTGDALDISAEIWNSFSEIDIIVSNPPYIPEKEKSEIAPNVLNFEPHLALFVEDQSPIIFYQRIAKIALKSLKKSGFLFFELHYKFAIEVEEYLKEIGFSEITIKKDLQGKNRMLRAKL